MLEALCWLVWVLMTFAVVVWVAVLGVALAILWNVAKSIARK